MLRVAAFENRVEGVKDELEVVERVREWAL